MSAESNPHEEAARLRKAYAIADALQRAFSHLGSDIPLAEVVRASSEEVWQTAAEAAKQHPASEHTRALVLSILEDRQAAASSDPFEGLPGADEPTRDLRPLTERALEKAREMKASGYRSGSGR